MKILLWLTVLFYFTICFTACSKQSAAPDPVPPGNSNPAGGIVNSSDKTNPSAISVRVNQIPINVNSIRFDRDGADFNFTAGNQLQKVEVRCFWFYQQSRWNFQYSDSITYFRRPNTLTTWSGIRAIKWGDVNFDCCYAPLTDSLVTGEYTADFPEGKGSFTVSGGFHLVF